MITGQHLQNAMFNATRADLSLKALYCLDVLLDPQAAHALPADLRRDLRLAAATVLRVKEADIDDETREQVANTLQQLKDRATHGEKFTAAEALRAAVEMLATSNRAAPEPALATPAPLATPAATTAEKHPDFPDLPGALTTHLPSPARLLRASAGADTSAASPARRPPRAPIPRPPPWPDQRLQVASVAA